MKKFSLTAIGRRHLDTARRVTSGRSANTVYGGHEHVLRQTVIALAAGQELNEHLNPGEATVLVLSGRIRLATQADRWDGRDGDLLVVPPGLYSVRTPFPSGASMGCRYGRKFAFAFWVTMGFVSLPLKIRIVSPASSWTARS